ncbi:Protein trichome birefringence-like 20 [Zea mays]|uniref:Protein trichome birefringence-like 20 n=2 Tax=Zea mays TaxID=4577 RepID=A0A3L6EMV9_MAIZE|nr:TRICHOME BIREFRINGENCE-LIKE 20 [Zea mays]PWZ22422.1 Protein trichome birefringence-like 20 [Zea mays]
MKPNSSSSSSQVVRRAASTTGLLFVVLLVAFTASNYSSLDTDRLLDVPPNAASHVQTTAPSSSSSLEVEKSAACDDVARGEWVPDPAAPYYTNATCPFIDSRQDCMKYGRPGLDSILRWRWQPHGCNLPRFDPAAFLGLVRHKSMAFVGDSVARNHMQSLMCLLSKIGSVAARARAQVEYPQEMQPKDCIHCTRTYHYREHNFTVTVFWAPFLVRWNLTRAGALQFMDPHNVYLDEADPEWARQVAGYDYVVLNGATWFTRPVVLHERGRVLGCSDCGDPNATFVPPHHAVRASFRTALRALREAPGFRGKVVVRTVAPPHYENGKWYDGGNCLRTRPMRSGETGLPDTEAAFHAAQVEEFRAAASAAPPGRFVLLDVSEMMQMRGDGHPGQYGHWPHEKVGFGIDCVHWCLPGPIDAWSDVLLHLITN